MTGIGEQNTGSAPPAPAAVAPDLLSQVHQADADDAGALPGAMPAAPADPSKEWIDAALNFGAFLRELHPITAREWTDDRLRAFGVALAKCAAHYGWTLGDFLKHPLAGLAVAAIPLAWPLAQPFVTQWMQEQRGKIAGKPAANDAGTEAQP